MNTNITEKKKKKIFFAQTAKVRREGAHPLCDALIWRS